MINYIKRNLVVIVVVVIVVASIRTSLIRSTMYIYKYLVYNFIDFIYNL